MLKQAISTLFCAALLAGCTNDPSADSGNGGTPSFAGNWQGTIVKSSDTCSGLSDPSSLVVQHRVEQSGNDITLTVTGGSTYFGSGETHLGSPTGNHEFTVSAEIAIDVPGCTLINTFTYSGITDSHAEVTRDLIQDCGGTVRCRAIYEGEASR